MVEVWGDPVWAFGGGSVGDFAIVDVERVLDLGTILKSVTENLLELQDGVFLCQKVVD